MTNLIKQTKQKELMILEKLIERIEELTELNTLLKENNVKLEKQVSELLELEEKENVLNEKIKLLERENQNLRHTLDELTEPINNRLKAFESVANIDVASISKSVSELQAATDKAQAAARLVPFSLCVHWLFVVVFLCLFLGGMYLTNSKLNETREALGRVGAKVNQIHDIYYKQ